MSDTRSRATGTPRGSDSNAADTPTWVDREPTVSRHGAIARCLFTYSNYKNWADEVRGAWEQPAATPSTKPRRR